MDFTALIKSSGPAIISFLQNFVKTVATPVHPNEAEPTPTVIAAREQSDAIKDLQRVINKLVKPVPLLEVDGWVGKKTEAGIFQAIAMLRSYGLV